MRKEDAQAVLKHGITVSVGYGWDKVTRRKMPGYEVLTDAFWDSLKEKFSAICKSVANSCKCRIDFRRLRATYGHSILESVLSHIRHSQALVFDRGAIRKGAKVPRTGYIDATGNLVAAHDAATAYLGAPWRMPTDAEFSALIGNCDEQWTTRGGVYGRLVTGRGAYAFKSIFLPLAGDGVDSDLDNTDYKEGCYWSSTPYLGYSTHAWGLICGSRYFSCFNRRYFRRCNGQSVRPVRGFANGITVSSVTGVTTHLKLDCRTGVRAPSPDGCAECVDVVCARERDAAGGRADG